MSFPIVQGITFTSRVPTPSVGIIEPKCYGDKGAIVLSNFVYSDGTAYDGSTPLKLSIKGPEVLNPVINSPSVTIPVVPGIYTVAVESQDLKCMKTLPVDEIHAVQQDLSATTALSCVGGSPAVTVTAAGGSSPYTYSLNGGTATANNLFTNLQPATTYLITYYDKNNCSKTISVTTPAAVAIASYTTKAPSGTMADGEITLTGTGGNAPYEYSLDKTSWQSGNTFTGLLAATYNVWARDSKGCISANPVTVPLEPLDFTTTTTSVKCAGYADGTITLKITGGSSPYKIKLDNGVYRANDNLFKDLSAGTYEVYVQDSRGVEMHHPVTVGSPTPVSFT
ncbi:SprB repeat-containing protein, partial [Chitinophaga dinghuensis]